MNERLAGYGLVAVGLLIILIAFFGVYKVFTNQGSVVNLFNLPGIYLDVSGLVGSDLSSEEAAMLRQKTGSLKAEIVSAELINKPLNLVAHLLFMGFLLNVGFKVASLGVQFVRPIKVNLREGKETKIGGEKNG